MKGAFIFFAPLSNATPRGNCYEQITEIKLKQAFLGFLLCYIVSIFRYVAGKSKIRKKTSQIFKKRTKTILRYLPPEQTIPAEVPYF